MDHEKYDMFLADKEYTDWLEYHESVLDTNLLDKCRIGV